MYNISEELKEILRHDYLPYHAPVEKSLVLSFARISLTLSQEDIYNEEFELDSAITTGESLSFGDCNSDTLKFSVEDLDVDIVGEEFSVKFLINGTEIPLGVYIVDQATLEHGTDVRHVVAYDLMSKFDIDVANWYNSLSYPMSLKSFRESLCNACGVEYVNVQLPNDNMIVNRTVSPSTLKGRDVLKACMQLAGAFGRINRQGKLDPVVLSKTSAVEVIDHTICDPPVVEECNIDVISKVQIRQEDGDVGAYVGNGTNCYSITGNFLVYGKSASELSTIASNVATNIIGLTYRPMQVSLQGLLWLDSGDKVNVSEYNTYMLNRMLKGVQILSDTYSIKGTKEIHEDTNVNTLVEQLKSKVNKFQQTVEEMSSTISEKIVDETFGWYPSENIYPSEYLYPCNTAYTRVLDQFQTQIHQTSKELILVAESIENTIENRVAAINLRSEQIEMNVQNLSENTSTSFTQLDNKVNIKVSKDELCNQINVAQDGISLKGNRVEIESTNFKLDREGNVECKNGKFSGNVGSNGLFSGDGRGNSVLIKDGMVSAKTEYQSDWNAFFAGTECYAPKVSCDALSFGNTVYSNTTLLTTSNYSSYLNSSYAISDHTHTQYAISGHIHTQYATNYHDHYSTEITAIDTGYGNISFGGSLNGASVTYVQENFQRISSSDARLKYDIKSIEAEKNIQDFYMKLKCKSYKFKDSKVDKNTHFGLLAQEVKKSIDECCLQDDWNIVEEYEVRKYMDEGMYVRDNTALRVNYEELHALHITMIQKQQREIEELKELVNSLLEEGRD